MDQRKKQGGEINKSAVRTTGAILLSASFWPALATASESLFQPGARSQLDENEVELITALDDVHDGNLDGGLGRLEGVVRRSPKFRLAWLVYADLLNAKAGHSGVNGTETTSDGAVVAGLRAEARVRVQHLSSLPPVGQLPEQLLQMSESQTRALVFDASRSRVFVIERNGNDFKLARDYYTSAGQGGVLKTREGDGKTPLGVYFVTSRLASNTLPNLYGSGAFPVNYPNEWDARLGRTGYGIWLHGVPSNTYSRDPNATLGCLAIPNPNLEALWDEINVGDTPVIMADRVRWADSAEIQRRRNEFLSAFEKWKQDWQSLEFQEYARHYSSEFRSGGKDQTGWLRQKQRINAGKTFIRVTETDMSIFAYPGERDLLVVTFVQDYRSNNFRDSVKKRQYWRREADGAWRIVYEGDATYLPIHLRGMPPSARAGLADDFRRPL